MDLTYGGEYERFRNEVRDFIATHRNDAPDGQGMRSDKNPRVAEDADRTRLHRANDSARVRRLRRRRGHPEVADHRRGIRAGAGAGRSRRPRHLDAGADAARDGHRRTETSVHRADAARRNDLVPGLFRTGRRQRPREPAHARRTRRRRVGRQRSEDLDQHRATRRLDLLSRAHRTECAETSGHQLPAVLDEDARHRSAAAEDDDRRRDVQRSVLHRRARAERIRSSAAAAKAGWWRIRSCATNAARSAIRTRC